MPKYTMQSEGKTYTFSSDSPLSDADLEAAAKQYFGPEQSMLGKVGQIAGEELGKVPGRMWEDVKGIGSMIANPKMADTLPMTLGPGAGAASTAMKIGQSGARALTTGLGRGLDKEGTVGQKAWEGAKAATVAGAWEAILGGLPFARAHRFGVPSIHETAGARRDQIAGSKAAQDTFKAAEDAVEKAYNAIKGHVDPGKVMFIPQIDPKNPISFRQAVDGLKKLDGIDWQMARDQIGKELNRIDRFRVGSPALGFKGPGAQARPQWRGMTPQARDVPGPLPVNAAGDRAIGMEGMLGDPALRTAVDTAATERIGGDPGVLIGSLPLLAIPEIGKKAYHGTRGIMRDIFGR